MIVKKYINKKTLFFSTNLHYVIHFIKNYLMFVDKRQPISSSDRKNHSISCKNAHVRNFASEASKEQAFRK